MTVRSDAARTRRQGIEWSGRLKATSEKWIEREKGRVRCEAGWPARANPSDFAAQPKSARRARARR
jgi:hypothetical protein